MGHFQNPRRPLDWNGLSGTITCNGGGSNVYHPDGRRKHTTRELLALQTFPPGFIVAGDNLTLRRRQIGNAVPPAFARTLFKTVLEWLKQRDADEARGIIV